MGSSKIPWRLKQAPGTQATIQVARERRNSIVGGLELAEAWRAFCADTKFACTKAESRRPDYEDIGDASEREDDVPTMEELELL